MIRALTLTCLLLFALNATPASKPALVLEFQAETPAFAAAAEAYARLWQTDGLRITAALERFTGQTLLEPTIDVIVFEGISYSGVRGEPMRLRASYPSATKQATIVHELLHRYLDQIPGIDACYPEIHDLMAMMLYQIWTELWGETFAKAQAQVESARSLRYQRSWTHALALDEGERQASIDSISRCRKPSSLK